MIPSGTYIRTVGGILLVLAAIGVAAGTPVRDTPQDVAPRTQVVAVSDEHLQEAPSSTFTSVAQVDGFDNVRVLIRITAEQSAHWSVQYRYRLSDETATAAFERARQNVTNPPGVFIERMRDAARRAESRTGREMAIQRGAVSTYTSAPHGRFGVVEYRFTWTGFVAQRADEQYLAGDVLNGYPLGANESLVFDWEEQFQLVDVAPTPNETQASTVRWDGPHRFSVEHPRLVLAPGSDAGGLTRITDPVVLLGVGGIVAIVTTVTVVFGMDADRLAAVLSRKSEERASDESSEPPAELLSDEERVLQLLEENGGRMKQQSVMDALDWSRTKTSNVVSDLQEDEKIEVYRIGRENTLALPGEMDL